MFSQLVYEVMADLVPSLNHIPSTIFQLNLCLRKHNKLVEQLRRKPSQAVMG